MAKFQVGEIVALKSGGPRMTVTQVGLTHNRVECTWFTPEAEIKTAYISESALVENN